MPLRRPGSSTDFTVTQCAIRPRTSETPEVFVPHGRSSSCRMDHCAGFANSSLTSVGILSRGEACVQVTGGFARTVGATRFVLRSPLCLAARNSAQNESTIKLTQPQVAAMRFPWFRPRRLTLIFHQVSSSTQCHAAWESTSWAVAGPAATVANAWMRRGRIAQRSRVVGTPRCSTARLETSTLIFASVLG